MTKKAESKKEQPKEPSLEELILNFPVGKYTAIPLAATWAKILRKREENRHLTQNEVLDLALKDILTGAIGWKEIKKAVTAAVGENGAESEEKSKK